MITVDTEWIRKIRLGKQQRVHARMAAALTLQTIDRERQSRDCDEDRNSTPSEEHKSIGEGLDIWSATWPTQSDFAQYMPLHWPEAMQRALPQQTQKMLAEQSSKFQEHWQSYLSLPNSLGSHYSTYKYLWSIVNSRCFYWERPQQAIRRQKGSHKRARTLPKVDSEDCMALVPFADYFNHAAAGCEFSSDASGCWITCDRDYTEGEEVVVSYGKHDNDMLLIEYGFTMDDNPYDKVMLDDLFEHSCWKARHAQMDLLVSRSYMGNLTLDRTGVCFRTEVALLSLVANVDTLLKFMDGEDVDESRIKRKADAKLTVLLNEEGQRVAAKLEELMSRKQGTDPATTEAVNIAATMQRWKQIHQIVSDFDRTAGAMPV